MLKMYDVVKLKHINKSIPLPVGSRGTILIVHDAIPAAYEVEFLDKSGQHLGVFTVTDTDLERDDHAKRR
jgi:hypothetical protein